MGKYRFKSAESPGEIEQVHRLNCRTFTREVPQHDDPGTGRLVDRFHEKNLYFVALSGERVVGMVSVNDRPPFSVEERLPDRKALARPGMKPLEVRLLALDPAARLGKAFAGLLYQVVDHARRCGHTHLVISGLLEREGLYRRLGFERLGPPVASGAARFVPMMARLAGLPPEIRRDIARWEKYDAPA